MKFYKLTIPALAAAACLCSCGQGAQNEKPAINDSNTALHLLDPDYVNPYGVPAKDAVKADLDRVLKYVTSETPVGVKEDGTLERGAFRLASYEWGVTYSGMLKAGETTGDAAYTAYTKDRHSFLAAQAAKWSQVVKDGGKVDPQMRQVVNPGALDDCGAVCVSMIRDQFANPDLDLRALIDNYVDFIVNREYRLKDGTLARMRPLANSVWLDDMFMGIPAIAWYGKLTGDRKYYDEALRQIMLFKDKMWVPEKKLFRHGWVESMDQHPAFFWGRANGWAILTMSEVLDAIPEGYPGRDKVLELFRQHAEGLAALQSSEGFWHQLLDRNDSYLETSATAIYAYCFAHGINEGWLNALAYGPETCLAWNAVSTMIDAEGKVNGTCVGTGMAFDPAFYYYRPVSASAAHGYGPVILAGAELIRLLDTTYPRLNDNAVQFYDTDHSSEGAIFAVKK